MTEAEINKKHRVLVKRIVSAGKKFSDYINSISIVQLKDSSIVNIQEFSLDSEDKIKTYQKLQVAQHHAAKVLSDFNAEHFPPVEQEPRKTKKDYLDEFISNIDKDSKVIMALEINDKVIKSQFPAEHVKKLNSNFGINPISMISEALLDEHVVATLSKDDKNNYYFNKI